MMIPMIWPSSLFQRQPGASMVPQLQAFILHPTFLAFACSLPSLWPMILLVWSNLFQSTIRLDTLTIWSVFSYIPFGILAWSSLCHNRIRVFVGWWILILTMDLMAMLSNVVNDPSALYKRMFSLILPYVIYITCS